jgi:hypothetical protein
MYKRFAFLLTLASLFFLLSSNTAAAQGRWEFLGKRQVNYTLDRDVINVTWRDGAFDAIRFTVTGGKLNMHRCVIHFENGGKQNIELKQEFDRNSMTRIVDLKGNNRLIEKIEFWYDTKNAANNKAVVSVFGKH